MMRLIRICLPLVLLLMMGSRILAQSNPSEKPLPTTAATQPNQHGVENATAVHKTSGQSREVVARKGAKRPEYRPEFNQNSVEVINGDATKKVVFHDEQNTPTAKSPSAALKGASAPMKVEVVNGAYTDTQFLYNNGEDQRIEAQLNRPVVVGVESSDTRVAGGNKHPVVTRVNTSGAGDAKAQGSGGQPVTKSISPRPKRPAYEPDEH